MNTILSPFRSIRDYTGFAFTRYPIITMSVLFSLILVIIVLVSTNNPPKVNGGWSDWENEKECNKTCGSDGFKIEKRICNNPEPSNMGESCVGPETRQVTCKLDKCPIDGQWSDWIQTSKCSAECGKDGMVSELRVCNNPAPQYGGEACQGNSVRNVPCNVKECPPPPINGGWSDWTKSECDAECGPGKVTLSRTCTNPIPQNGGLECVGNDKQQFDCKQKDCSVDGGWSEWKPTEQCSKTCGGGLLKMTRVCDNPKPQFGGKECDGPIEKDSSMPCNPHKCPLNEKECNELTHGPYPKECLSKWFKDVSCTNNDYIQEYPNTYDGVKGWWHSQEPEIVKQDMRNWALNPFWGSRFKSICLPKNFAPINQQDCDVSNSYWDSQQKKCITSLDPKGHPKLKAINEK